ncbi:MAG: biopolymer transporter ExbD [candidate division KSB1 bacterium]|nr:biopolymer transporter ExbD [candidate division KSB1 bacterium]MDQ7064576.1 biopolymer transporter ExbD [candidate division KSB1 bacterium]
MAYRPSFRRTIEGEEVEPNLTPVMNLMVVLIPLLLTSAEFIKIGSIELNLPPAAGPVKTVSEKPQEKVKNLDLTVSITDEGFYISSALAVLRPKSGAGPSIPKKPDGSFDFQALSEKLYEIKQKAQGKFPDLENIIIQAEPGIDYQTLVSTMDASRTISINHRQVVLFPQVSLSAGIIEQ